MGNWLDLHLHSNVSNDGEFTPEELMEKCSAAGLRTISLTDHNSVRGVKRARAAANKLKIDFLSGTELDCQYKRYNLHLLCYGICEEDAFFHELERDVERQEQEASQKRVDLVVGKNIYVDREKVQHMAVRGVITGEMIAEAALGDPRNEGSEILSPYREGGERGDNPYVNFYWDFCSQGKVAYVPMKFIQLEEAVQRIKSMGGITVLAHPYANIGRNPDLFGEIAGCGIDGVEAYSSYHDIESVEFYLQKAGEYDLLVTAGSDFHGKIKPAIGLGNIKIEKQEEAFADIMMKLKGAKGQGSC